MEVLSAAERASEVGGMMHLRVEELDMVISEKRIPLYNPHPAE